MKPKRLLLLIWAGTVLTLLIARWGYYFDSPVHEHGDQALNAIQIDRAKDLAEIHGNYSRFRFHHPGPAFFYVYAAAEIVLCDWFKLPLTPFNAHTLAGLGLQAFFFALGLTLAAEMARSRLFMPLALFAGAAHFSLVDYALWSIWPPHVLLMSFLAFLISAVSLGTGRSGHVGWVVLCGSFLVHGHVAQPLFVLPLFLGAYVCCWRQCGPPWRAAPRAHLVAAAVLAFFLLPLAVDAMRGSESNLAQIIRYASDNTESWKKPLKALLYVVSFFGYVRNQDEVLRELSTDSLVLFRAHAPAFLAWVVLLSASAFAWARLKRKPEFAAFWRLATGFWIVTVLLSIAWAILQTGRMFEFNSYFFHAVSYLALFPLFAWCADWISTFGYAKSCAAVCVAVAVIVGLAGFRHGPLTPEAAGTLRLAVVDQTLARQTADRKPILLVFGQDEWPNAAAVAVALHRRGVDYRVDTPWEFMHPGRSLSSSIPMVAPAPFAVWRILPASGSPEEIALDDRQALVLGAQELPPAGLIDFSESGNSARYVVCGINRWDSLAPEAWLSGDNAIIEFRPYQSPGGVVLEMTLAPWLPGDRREMPPLEIFFNGRPIHRVVVTTPQRLRLRLPAEEWHARSVATLRLHLHGARNPREPGLPSDWSGPGVSLQTLTIAPTSPSSTANR